MFKIKVADLVIEINEKYLYIKKLCRDYIVSDLCVHDFTVEVTNSEISDEDTDNIYDNGYLECLAIYRKIAERITADYNGFLLHGVILGVNNRGIAIGAKSGTGKSTHAHYWKEYLGENCTIVNGDKPLIRFINGKCYAYGTPWCGKENYNINTCVVLTDFCTLYRHETNMVTPVKHKKDALIHLVNSMYLPYEDKELFEKTMNLCDLFLQKVNFWNIYCNMSIEAAETAYNAIFGDNSAK